MLTFWLKPQRRLHTRRDISVQIRSRAAVQSVAAKLPFCCGVSVCVRVREWLGKVCVPVEVWMSGFLCAFVPACAFCSFAPVCVFVLILEMAAGKESLWCVTEQLIISHSAPHTVETRRGRDWGSWKRSAVVKEEICSPLWPGLNINCAARPQLNIFSLKAFRNNLGMSEQTRVKRFGF